jgi:hypothetical protein
MSLKDAITASMMFPNYFLKISLNISDEKTVAKNSVCSFSCLLSFSMVWEGSLGGRELVTAFLNNSRITFAPTELQD